MIYRCPVTGGRRKRYASWVPGLGRKAKVSCWKGLADDLRGGMGSGGGCVKGATTQDDHHVRSQTEGPVRRSGYGRPVISYIK